MFNEDNININTDINFDLYVDNNDINEVLDNIDFDTYISESNSDKIISKVWTLKHGIMQDTLNLIKTYVEYLGGQVKINRLYAKIIISEINYIPVKNHFDPYIRFESNLTNIFPISK